MSQSNKRFLINTLTLLRILGIPVVFLLADKPVILFLFVNFLFFTDFLDGYFARKYEVASTLGAILDLLADKVLVITLLFSAWLGGHVAFILFALIAFREVSSMVTRFKHFKSEGELIPASLLGKTKTTFQFIGLSMLMLLIPGYNLVLWIVVGLSYYSYFQYLGAAKEGK